MDQTTERLKRPTFENSLKVWPYRLAGPPLDEVIAMANLHKMRLTHPGMTDKERNDSLRWLQARNLYMWVIKFGTPIEEMKYGGRKKSSPSNEPSANRRGKSGHRRNERGR